MPKAYWIVRVSVRDSAHYPEYLVAAKPAFEKFGANFIVRGGDFALMEVLRKYGEELDALERRSNA